MAIGWLTVLQNVPWAEVIRNAPKVAEGAKKLWSSVSKAPPAADPDAPLQAQVAALEVSVETLKAQLAESSQLVAALAEQNARLVERIEANRRKLVWLAAATAVFGAAAIAGLVLVLA